VSVTSSKPHRPYSITLVAWYEAIKGVLALLAGAGVLTLLHRDMAGFAEKLVAHLHLNLAKDHPRIFVEALSRVHDTQLLLIAAAAAGYAVLRLVLAAGLWREKEWAEWLTALSAGIYIPFELYELARGLTWIRAAAFVGNILIVLFMVNAIKRGKAAHAARSAAAFPVAETGSQPPSP
jgi:uncharacterized membrane protein (DUF2068 family)